jgi:hypothetical protein
MDRFAITRDGASVHVDLNRLYEADQHAAEWSDAAVKVT